MISTNHLSPENLALFLEKAESLEPKDFAWLVELKIWTGSACCADWKNVENWVKWHLNELKEGKTIA